MLIAPQYSWCADVDEGEDEDGISDSSGEHSDSDEFLTQALSADGGTSCKERVSHLLEHAKTLPGGDQKAQVARDLAVLCKQTGRMPSSSNQLARASDPGKNKPTSVSR